MNFIKKDITTILGPAVIAHGVNCQRTMGSGVAKALYEKWPQVRENYMQYGSMELGDIQPIQVGTNSWVVNCFTQHKFGTDGDKYANEESLYKALYRCALFAQGIGISHIYSPRIGCGLGGLNWKMDVYPIFLKIQRTFPFVVFTICDL